MTDDLVAFLRRMLDADEQAARNTGQPSLSWQNFDMDGELRDDFNAGTVALIPRVETRVHIARHDPTRVLAEVDAQRRIVNRCDAALGMDDGYGAAFLAEQVLRDLAAPYREHPEYRPGWAPGA